MCTGAFLFSLGPLRFKVFVRLRENQILERRDRKDGAKAAKRKPE
jgi:hypothetical protein